MIKKAHRFHGRNSLRHVYRHGKTVRRPMLSLKYLENPRRQNYRLAVVVSKKVSKSAVVRNRIRRRLYEIIRHQSPNINRPYDMVLTVFSDQLAGLPHQELVQLVQGQLIQANIVPKAIKSSNDGS